MSGKISISTIPYEALRRAFIAGHQLQELYCFLLQSLHAPLSGLPSALYLDFRRRTHEAIEALKNKGVDANTLSILGASSDHLLSRRQLGGPVNDDTRLGWLMEQSVAAAHTLDVAMADARGQLREPELICYSSGWAISGAGFYSRMVLRFPQIMALGGSPSALSRQTQVDLLIGTINATKGFLDWVEAESLSESVIETAHISTLHQIVELVLANPGIPDNVASAVQEYADQVLDNLGCKTIFDVVLEELENMYVRKQFPKLSLEPDATNDEVEQLLEQSEREQNRYYASKDLADLDDAIKSTHAALTICSPDSFTYKACLDRYAGLLWERYLHSGSRSDLDQSVSMAWRILRETPWYAPTVGSMLNNLGLAQTTLFEQEQKERDIELAIDALREAIGDEAKPTEKSLLWWNNYANAVRLRYHHISSDIRDLDEVIFRSEAVLHATPHGSPDTAIHMQNLANALSDRVMAMGDKADPADLDRAIDLLNKAISDETTSEIDRSTCLANLATLLRQRFLLHARSEDFKNAIETYRMAVRLLDARLPRALKTAIEWGDWAFERRAWNEAIEAYNQASRISEELFSVQIARPQQESFLHSTQGVAVRAAYSLAQVNRLEDAVVVLESGLARMLANVLEKNRQDLERLKEIGHGNLYNQYRQIADALAAVGGLINESQHDHPTAYESVSSIDQLREAFKDTIAGIRQISGYERFLEQLSFGEIQHACDILLVYIIPTLHSGLALVVEPGQQQAVIPIPLKDMNARWVYQKVQQHLDALQEFKASPGTQADFLKWSESLDRLLFDLWKVIIEQLTKTLDGNVRVTLIPVGVLQLLPLHAAFAPNPDIPTKRRYAVDLMDITYAPNARSLLADKYKSRPSPIDSTLAVQISNSKRHGSLPNAALEIDLLKRCFDDVTCLKNEEATRSAILSIVGNQEFLHFCCHGFAQLWQPLESGLIVADDDELTLRDILRLRPGNVRFAMLSACETGMAAVNLPDEVVSWPTGLMQLGLSAIVSTLWVVEDLATALIVGRFYYLWRVQGRPPINALLESQRWLRDSTNGDKVSFLEQLGPWEQETPAANLIRYLQSQARDNRAYSHPLYWAPFYWTGTILTAP